MSKVVITARLPGRLEEWLAGHTLVMPTVEEGVLPPERIARELADAEAIIPLTSVRIDEALLAQAPALRIVANYGVGYDNVDVAAATRRRIAVTNTPGVLTQATADLTMALVLAAARRLGEGFVMARAGGWTSWTPDQLLGLDLDGARLGLVGLGRIGQAVAARARGFGMRIAYAARRPAGPEVERALEAERWPLDRLLAESDVVSLHCPLTAETRGLIGARELGLMKPTAVLINTARGPVVDTGALVAALGRGHLQAVGLDVFDHEPHIPEALRADPRAIVLPHMGSAARGTRTRMAELAAGNVAALLAGRRPPNVLNPEVL